MSAMKMFWRATCWTENSFVSKSGTLDDPIYRYALRTRVVYPSLWGQRLL